MRTYIHSEGALQTDILDNILVTGDLSYQIKSKTTYFEGLIQETYVTTIRARGKNASKIRGLLDRLDQLDEEFKLRVDRFDRRRE